jgi:hypothetical protein
MARLTSYSDFLSRLDKLGFMPLSNLLPGLPSLSDETEQSDWHTGNRETDPWQWKDRVTEEKRAAYGTILGGNKGFVAPRLYAQFYVACRPAASLEERWEAGELNQLTWEAWQLFEQRSLLNTSDVRQALGVSAKGAAGGRKLSAGQVDKAISQLQKEFYITIAGVRQKVGKDGQPYGWPASVYDRVENWAPADWLQPAAGLKPDDAWEQILQAGEAMSAGVDLKLLAKKLGKR